MDHPELETLSAFLDDEATVEERDWITRHVGDCPTCTVNLTVLERGRSAMRALDEVVPTPDERRQIRHVVLERTAPRRWGVARPPRRAPLWGLTAAMAAVVGAIVFVNVSRQGSDQHVGSSLHGTAADSQSQIAIVQFNSPEEVRSTVEGWNEVKEGVDLYTVADVGLKQEKAILEVAPPKSEEAAPSGGGKKTTVEVLDLDAKYPAGSDQRCLRSVLQSQRHPTMPVLVRQAVFRSEPAWLLVYVWTPVLEEGAKLDRLQYWLVRPSDCTTLNYSSLRL